MLHVHVMQLQSKSLFSYSYETTMILDDKIKKNGKAYFIATPMRNN